MLMRFLRWLIHFDPLAMFDGERLVDLLRLGLSEPHMSICGVCGLEAVCDYDVLLRLTDTVPTVGHIRFCVHCKEAR